MPKRFILTVRPKEYLEQGLSHCGAYCVKAMLSAFGKDAKNHPKEYHPGWLGRLTGLTLGKEYYVNILKGHGVRVRRGVAQNLNGTEKIHLLQTMLSKNLPVMIRIGNGYITNHYNPIIGKLQSHWITLWGYDDNKQVFYVYDSGLQKRYWGKNLAVGNTTRTYDEIIRDWNFGLWQFWTWPFSGRASNVYIEVLNPN